MERCINDIFSYCSTPERKVTSVQRTRVLNLIGQVRIQKYTYTSCHLNPKTCPYLKHQDQLATAKHA